MHQSLYFLLFYIIYIDESKQAKKNIYSQKRKDVRVYIVGVSVFIWYYSPLALDVFVTTFFSLASTFFFLVSTKVFFFFFGTSLIILTHNRRSNFNTVSLMQTHTHAHQSLKLIFQFYLFFAFVFLLRYFT